MFGCAEAVCIRRRLSREWCCCCCRTLFFFYSKHELVPLCVESFNYSCNNTICRRVNLFDRFCKLLILFSIRWICLCLNQYKSVSTSSFRFFSLKEASNCFEIKRSYLVYTIAFDWTDFLLLLLHFVSFREPTKKADFFTLQFNCTKNHALKPLAI